MHIRLVLDFDSTLIQAETLDVLGEVALKGDPRKKEILDEIVRITRNGMEGLISFEESLTKRIALFPLNTAHIAHVARILKTRITPSILASKDFFATHARQIYVVSGGFRECMEPVLSELGIVPQQVFANSFLYDAKGSVTGFNPSNPLARSGGKSHVVRSLSPGCFTVMVGDGYTDLEVKLSGAADRFIAYTECVDRPAVSARADSIAHTFRDVITYYRSL